MPVGRLEPLENRLREFERVCRGQVSSLVRDREARLALLDIHGHESHARAFSVLVHERPTASAHIINHAAPPGAQMGELAPFLRRRPDGRPRLMGILNVTPDSFHAKSRVSSSDAVKVGTQMIADGADWLDVGGESTRPGASPVSIEEELQRVIPVISALIENHPSILISIDTRRASVAEAALRAGASMINDVSGLRSQEMFDLVVESGCAVCIMHMQGEPDGMQSNPAYSDVRTEVEANLVETASSLVSDGHDPALICLDPGIGFGKDL
ncbi:MAG TPA: dihydropteroate synthase, partial [Candidatus Poseidoniales archaeon]|nr:dihydropteroate synthase [Candidatus Poseidoniales archaeon]